MYTKRVPFDTDRRALVCRAVRSVAVETKSSRVEFYLFIGRPGIPLTVKTFIKKYFQMKFQIKRILGVFFRAVAVGFQRVFFSSGGGEKYLFTFLC